MRTMRSSTQPTRFHAKVRSPIRKDEPHLEPQSLALCQSEMLKVRELSSVSNPDKDIPEGSVWLPSECLDTNSPSRKGYAPTTVQVFAFEFTRSMQGCAPLVGRRTHGPFARKRSTHGNACMAAPKRRLHALLFLQIQEFWPSLTQRS